VKTGTVRYDCWTVNQSQSRWTPKHV